MGLFADWAGGALAAAAGGRIYGDRYGTMTMRQLVAATGAAAITATCIAFAVDLPRSVSAAGVEFKWALKDDRRLHGCVLARTRGWIAVGFNTRPELDGARLVMGRVVDGRAEVELHRAAPPQHFRIVGAEDAVRIVAGAYDGGVTRLCFVMPLDPIDRSDVTLEAGAMTHLVLAWSRERSFNHHSADRGAVDVAL